MEGGIFLYTEQIASSELLLEALDGFNGIFVGGMEAFPERPRAAPLIFVCFWLFTSCFGLDKIA